MAKKKILIVDDQPITCKGYEMVMQKHRIELGLGTAQIESVFDAASAHGLLLDYAKRGIDLKLFIYEIFIAPCPKKGILSSTDLGKLVKELFPNAKIIVSTQVTSKYTLYHVFKKLNPDGLLVKPDFGEEVFKRALENVFNGFPYYSRTFNEVIRDQFSAKKTLEDNDREILYRLSMGVRSKELTKYVPWSISKINKRKKALRKFFQIEEKSTQALVMAARDAGII